MEVLVKNNGKEFTMDELRAKVNISKSPFQTSITKLNEWNLIKLRKEKRKGMGRQYRWMVSV